MIFSGEHARSYYIKEAKLKAYKGCHMGKIIPTNHTTMSLVDWASN